MEKQEYIQMILRGMQHHCKRWSYNWFEKLKENPTEQTFHKLFCKITRTYFFSDNEGNYYSVYFSKEGSVTVKKCGPDYGKREEDTTIMLCEILEIMHNQCQAQLYEQNFETKELNVIRKE